MSSKDLGFAGDIGMASLGPVGQMMGSRKAAEKQERAAKAQQDLFAGQAAKYDPYVQAGNEAMKSYQAALTGNPEDSYNEWMNSPAVQYQLQQALGNVEGSAAARGSLFSGNTLKALQGTGQGIMGQQHQGYLGNLQNLMTGGVNALSGQGQNIMGQSTAMGNVGAAQAGAILGPQQIAADTQKQIVQLATMGLGG